MDHTDWRILQYIGTGISISKVADHLFISQPAVSYRLARMEEEFKTELFIRTNRGLSLTDSGKRLHSYSTRMLSLENEIRLSVSTNSANVVGHIVIGSVSSFACDQMPDQLIMFQKMYNNISVDISVGHSPELIRRLENSDIPIVIVRGRNFDKWEGQCFEISSEMAIIVASEPITRDYLNNTPCLNTMLQNPATPMTQLQEIAEEWAIQKGGKIPKYPKIRINGNSHMLIQFVKRGFGWAVVTSSKIQESDGLYNKVIYDANGQPFPYRTCMLYRKDILEFDAYRAFIEHFTNFYSRKGTMFS